jgi:hypothetical protein
MQTPAFVEAHPQQEDHSSTKDDTPTETTIQAKQQTLEEEQPHTNHQAQAEQQDIEPSELPKFDHDEELTIADNFGIATIPQDFKDFNFKRLGKRCLNEKEAEQYVFNRIKRMRVSIHHVLRNSNVREFVFMEPSEPGLSTTEPQIDKQSTTGTLIKTKSDDFNHVNNNKPAPSQTGSDHIHEVDDAVKSLWRRLNDIRQEERFQNWLDNQLSPTQLESKQRIRNWLDSQPIPDKPEAENLSDVDADLEDLEEIPDGEVDRIIRHARGEFEDIAEELDIVQGVINSQEDNNSQVDDNGANSSEQSHEENLDDSDLDVDSEEMDDVINELEELANQAANGEAAQHEPQLPARAPLREFTQHEIDQLNNTISLLAEGPIANPEQAQRAEQFLRQNLFNIHEDQPTNEEEQEIRDGMRRFQVQQFVDEELGAVRRLLRRERRRRQQQRQEHLFGEDRENIPPPPTSIIQNHPVENNGAENDGQPGVWNFEGAFRN